MLNSKFEHALHYASYGIPVLPLHYIKPNGICSCGGSEVNPKCKPGKHPFGGLVPHGLSDATTDQGKIKKWFDGTPYNLGISTGDVSNFFVLDRDDKDGGDKTLAAWESENGELPKTLAQQTGNGMHYLFKMPAGVDIRNMQKKADSPGIDVRGNGGYICAAPSIHFSGRMYKWVGSVMIDTDKIAEAPQWIIDKITSKHVKVAKSGQTISMIDAIVGPKLEIPEVIKDGEGRESFLLRYAGRLRGKGLDQSDIEHILFDYNRLHIDPPLDEESVLDKARRYAHPKCSGEIDSSWNNPQEVKASLPPVPEFDFAMLPPVFHSWIKDIAERMQCPPDFLAVGAMVAVGSLLGNKIGIQPKQLDEGWVEVPNIWGVVVGRPGVMKTPALAQVLAPLKALESKAMRAHSSEIAQYQFNKLLYEANFKAIKNQVAKGACITPSMIPVEPQEPQPRRYLLNDATYQKIGEVLQGNPNGLMVFQDEFSGLLMRLDADGQESARAFYLQAWEGKQSYTFDRIERGTIGIPRLCFSMLGGIQPGKIREYLRSALNGGKGDDGLAQRLQLLVYPDNKTEWQYIDRVPDTQAADDAIAVFERLANLDPYAIGAVDNCYGIPVLKFDEQAQSAFTKWLSGLEVWLRKGNKHSAIESHFSKYRKLIPCLAFLDHLIRGNPGSVKLQSVEVAIRWHAYLAQHAKRVYAVVTASTMDSAKTLYDKINRGALLDGFTVRDIYRKGWTGLASQKEAQEAVEVLIDHGWLQPAPEKSTGSDGRPTVHYKINPQIRKVA